MGVATVGLLYLAVRRWAGAGAGLHRRRRARADAGRDADVPVQQPRRAARAAADGRGVRHGAGDRDGRAPAGSCSPACSSASRFLTKMLQAFLVAARRSRWSTSSPRRRPLRRRIVAAARRGRSRMVVVRRLVGRDRRAVAGRRSRPYIGGSQTNSVLELILGYNGLGRITGDETGSVTGGGGRRCGGGSTWGATGWGRMFTADYRRSDRLADPGRARLLASRCSGSPGARRAPTAAAPRDRSGAAGSLVTGLTSQLRAGHHPRVLHGRPGAGDRCARRHRRGDALVAARTPPRRGSRSRSVSRRRLSGPSCCSVAARRTGMPWLRYVVLVARHRRALAILVADRLYAPCRGRRSPRSPLVVGAARRRRRTRCRPRRPRTPGRSAQRRPDRRRRPAASAAGRSGCGGGPQGGVRRPRTGQAPPGGSAGGTAPGGHDDRRRRPAAASRCRAVAAAGWAGCSTPAPRAPRSSRCWRRTRRPTPGSRRRSAPQRRPATSSPPASR